ncbi:MAG: hypothetical protein JWR85_4039 [Marmoricola sp.]|nr:hypothetical protein [Marmoricola sp.]
MRQQFPINSFLFALSTMSFPKVDGQHNNEGDSLEFEPLARDVDRFVCMDCGVDTNEIREYFMVDDHIWNKHVPEYHGFLCIGCLESRMGRTLDATDFPAHLPINHPDGLFYPHSERLRTRLTTNTAVDRSDIYPS